MSTPSDRYAVLSPYTFRDGNNQDRTGWTEVGIAFEGQKGLTVLIRPGLSVMGKLILKRRHPHADVEHSPTTADDATSTGGQGDSKQSWRPAAFVYEAGAHKIEDLV